MENVESVRARARDAAMRRRACRRFLGGLRRGPLIFVGAKGARGTWAIVNRGIRAPTINPDGLFLSEYR